MANPNVRKQLERIARELAALQKHVAQYSGVSADEARAVDRDATEIAVTASALAAAAREAVGNKSGAGLVKKVRKTLGFTYP